MKNQSIIKFWNWIAGIVVILLVLNWIGGISLHNRDLSFRLCRDAINMTTDAGQHFNITSSFINACGTKYESLATSSYSN